jgi:hypothetical protein
MSANRNLIQVVPQLLPARCGVSDHAIALASQLKSGYGIEASFVVLNSDERCDLPYPVTYCAPHQLLDACAALSGSQPAAILVHLSGYGYSADGAPTLLAAALEQVKADGRFPLAVFFHELYASGTPWSSAFWHARRQKRAYRRIAQACDLPATNARVFARWLERHVSAPVQCLPVFSQAGEPEERILFAGRDPALVVFGLAATRQRAYAELGRLGDTLERLAVREILDIGPPCETPREVNGIPVKPAGLLGVAEIDHIFSRTAFGYLAYPPNCLAKSGVFAAYAAHGMVPLLARPFRGEFDGLRGGVQVLSPQTARAMTPEALDACSRAAWRWYAGHRLRHHAAIYAQWLGVGEEKGQNPEPGAERHDA